VFGSALLTAALNPSEILPSVRPKNRGPVRHRRERRDSRHEETVATRTALGV
jgi:hypothetical protein